ncbi:hypothetical protein KBTX_04259 [wastewater metagenome]|uniref:ATP synthase protein I n=2 Tax=unclassified sequences TaxID=12908 RepID=A0A5B8RIK0_9ZZZZ|nr:AtpZ/AtpI family protein [Arhodomonas aquaeolei]MCS4503344.1 AtpZ/AtpI family protein [Arhodomonas aquaeolei]QEA07893.1 hypothetical protein KBTEX_04259 [uncultured organism]
MRMNDTERLKREVRRQAARMRRAERDRPTLMAQTVYLTTLGLLLVIPVVAGAYLGLWLDGRDPGYSVYWTPVCLVGGVVLGASNVYLFIRGRDR